MTNVGTSIKVTAFSRKSPHYQGLDGLRALAIMWVMGFHSLGPIGAFCGHGGGWAGVDVFFVISGFLITSILLREFANTGTISFKNFYARRMLRLLPAYYLFLSFMCIVNPCHSPHILNAAGICVVYLSNYDRIFGWGNVVGTGTELTWSLSVEEQFYFFWPTIILFARNHLWKCALFLIIACQTWKAYLLFNGADWLRISSGFDTRIDVLMFGCLAAIAIASEAPKKWLEDRIFSNQWIGIFLLLVLLIYVRGIGHPWGFSNHWAQVVYWNVRMTGLSVITTLLVLSLALQPQSLISRAIGNPVLAWIGRISYSLYLWHIVAFLQLMQMWGPLGHWYQELSGYILAIIFAAASYYFVEKPFLKIKHKFELTSVMDK